MNHNRMMALYGALGCIIRLNAGRSTPSKFAKYSMDMPILLFYRNESLRYFFWNKKRQRQHQSETNSNNVGPGTLMYVNSAELRHGSVFHCLSCDDMTWRLDGYFNTGYGTVQASIPSNTLHENIST